MIKRESLTTFLALIVAGVWTISALAAMLTGESTVLAAITPVMLIVMGFLFGYRSQVNGKKEGQE